MKQKADVLSSLEISSPSENVTLWGPKDFETNNNNKILKFADTA